MMNWTTALERAIPGLSPENEEGLIWLLDDEVFAAFFRRAFNGLTRAQQAAATSAGRDALTMVSPRLREALLRFAEKIGRGWG